MPPVAIHEASGAFPVDLFAFLRDLKSHNDRDWFAAHKTRYDASVKEPCLAFIRAVGPGLQNVSRHIVADPRPVGGSMFRIHRDIRFSKDKSPYKTHAGLHFSHRASTDDRRLPGFYLHLEPGDCGTWAGVWHPDAAGLQRIREAIGRQGAVWGRLTRGRERWGDSLKRVPRGFDADHPLADELKRKDFLVGQSYTEAQVAAVDFRRRFVEDCRAMAPFNAFLAKATGAPW